jgi:hypothetical protein
MPDEPNRQVESRGGGSSNLALLFVLFIRELIVDFLAILVPGFWFIVASFPAFLFPLFYLVRLYDNGGRQTLLSDVQKFSSAISVVHTEFFVSVIVVSYLMGHLMFRQDPKRPDELSWIKVHLGTSNPKKLSYRLRWLWRTLGSDTRFPIREEILKAIQKDPNSSEYFTGMVRPLPDHTFLTQVRVDFPYSHLANYLRARGFDDLTGDVKWKGDDQASLQFRSKHFINKMKAALEFNHPEKIRELTRIESHIRLHSSLWYACLYLRYLSLAGIVLGVLCNLLLWRNASPAAVSTAILPTLVYLASFLVQGLIENSFHYQRTREVFYVLRYIQLANEQSRPSERPEQSGGKPSAFVLFCSHNG